MSSAEDPSLNPTPLKQYEWVCAAIKASDEVSFKLLAFPPLFTGATSSGFY